MLSGSVFKLKPSFVKKKKKHWFFRPGLSHQTLIPPHQPNWPFLMNSALADLIGTYFVAYSSLGKTWTVTHADRVWLLMIKYIQRPIDTRWSQPSNYNLQGFVIELLNNFVSSEKFCT